MSSQSTPPLTWLEQAHLALIRGDLAQARSVLDRLVVAEPDNAAAQDLRATVIARQAAAAETARLRGGNLAGAAQPAQTNSLWTRPLPDPASALFNSPSARKWPKPVLLAACLLSGVLLILLPGRHHHAPYHSSWGEEIAFGLAAGVALFLWIALRKR